MLVLLATVPHLRSLSSPDLVPPLRPPQNPNGLVQIVAVKVVLSVKGLLGVLHYKLVVQLIRVVEVEALRFLGVQGFTLFLEEVVRLGSGDAAPFSSPV
ncbi:hypothetical protein F2Q69_00058501 [Brassica cretica]|uniref:Uncharacterized protein n=1 Tax=Brassica cretica TaxID=69181 RepID=A0A8S9RER7_BRACR|nr:hypothetical protein F2Q69_00058501 [Brassica cretica]